MRCTLLRYLWTLQIALVIAGHSVQAQEASKIADEDRSLIAKPQNYLDLGIFLRTASIRKELDVTDEQIVELEAIEKEMKTVSVDLFNQIEAAAREDRKALIKELHERRYVLKEQAAKVLLPFQLTRLKQLALQSLSRHPTNGFGLLSPELSKELRISNEQSQIIKSKSEAAQKEISERERELRKELDSLRKKLRDEILEQLDPAQSRRHKELHGEWLLITD